MRSMTLRRKEAFVGMLFVLPFLAGFLLFYIIPFGISVCYSFTQGIGGTNFAGLKNYREIFGSYAFRLAASNTFRFMGIGIPLIMFVSLGLALLIFGSAGHTRIFQSVFLYPMVIPIGSVVMFIQVMLSEYGVINRVLYQLGFREVRWLDSKAAFSVLLFFYIWKNCGYNMILFLTGLNAVPKECEEAAKLEGAGRWQYFRYIQCPLLIPSFLFVFVMSVINSFKCYREAYLLGGRYPDDSIYMLQHFMNNNFESLNYQRLSVAAMLVFLIIFALVILLFAGKYRMEQDGTGRRRNAAVVRGAGRRKKQWSGAFARDNGKKKRNVRGKTRQRERREPEHRDSRELLPCEWRHWEESRTQTDELGFWAEGRMQPKESGRGEERKKLQSGPVCRGKGGMLFNDSVHRECRRASDGGPENEEKKQKNRRRR